ncbi:hypothetical protein [Salmon gill poxvirus]|uniref:Uncharacterized protein n=1 Tax=Salmon gill poxvirus TaxID=1680908 RepID=A0A0H4Y193_9POXV|nr:hypothetical protein AL387_gp053 [Salmon gill poxvirus]AKR04177.1 hypothetical protein SGPV053 [Salmon gill poxvirus]
MPTIEESEHAIEIIKRKIYIDQKIKPIIKKVSLGCLLLVFVILIVLQIIKKYK